MPMPSPEPPPPAHVVSSVTERAIAARPKAGGPEHPQLSEILIAVPQGPGGDANKDGTTHPTGDEFVELYNPHSTPVELEGYALLDRSAMEGSSRGAVRFEFPACSLGPGAFAVVFNGPTPDDARSPGAVGSGRVSPSGPHAGFGGALVFSMGYTGRARAFANGGDLVALIAPDGTPIECVAWGSTQPGPDAGPVMRATSVRGRSVVRSRDSFVPHDEAGGRWSSPGVDPRPLTESVPGLAPGRRPDREPAAPPEPAGPPAP